MHERPAHAGGREPWAEALEACRGELERLQTACADLRKSGENFRLLADHDHDWGTWLDPAGTYKYVSPSCERITGYPPGDFLGRPELLLQIAHPEDRAALKAHLEEVHVGMEASGIDLRIIRKDGATCWISHKCQPVFGSGGEYLGRRGSNREVTELKRLELILTARLRVAEELARNGDLHAILGVLLESVEAIWPGRPLSILLMDPVSRTLRYGADRGLPAFYRKAVEGMAVGPGVGSGGAACHSGRTVLVEDVETHPNWAPFLGLARKAGFRSCWAEPIRDVSGQVLGAFVVHAPAPCAAEASDQHLLSETAHLAGMAIAQHRIDSDLRLRTMALEAAYNSVVITDTRGIIEYVNPRFTEITGYTKEEVIGANPRILKSGDTPEAVYAAMWRALESGRMWRGEFCNRRKDGTLFWELATIAPVTDPSGRTTHFVAIKEDITSIKAAKEQLEHLALHDALTGLPNRRLFQERLRQSLVEARRRKSRLAVLYLDLDGFKEINDTFGHEAGDALLVAASQRLKACFRETDTLARMGGDEFTALLVDANEESGVERVAQACIQALEEPFQLPGGRARIGVSVGLALHPGDGSDADALLSAADRAMYGAKRSGKACWRWSGQDPRAPRQEGP